jgi:peptide/nickel transport system permease protein
VGEPFAPPSLNHPLGLDDGGVDMLSLIIAGARVSLLVGVLAAVVAVAIGGFVGIVAGYWRGWIEVSLMRFTDYVIVIPQLALMIAITAVWGSSVWHVIIVIGVLSWTSAARVIRAEVMSVRERVYVKRARSLGAGNGRIVTRHILPHLGPLVAACMAIAIADAVFLEAALAFLGLGDPNVVSWGALIQIAFARGAVTHGAWWAIVPPGACIALLVIAFSMIGRGMEGKLNPRLRTPHVTTRSFRTLVGRDKDAT